MKVCFPVKQNEGIKSAVFGHFGSAPIFLVVDMETKEVAEVINRDLHHEHGKCSPVRALGGKEVDAVVVGGIGGGALGGLNRAGIQVFKAQGATVEANIEKFATNELSIMSSSQCCGGHGHGNGHGNGNGCGH
jgi:predicted Fe-Mo cluster-binding NifX family protein